MSDVELLEVIIRELVLYPRDIKISRLVDSRGVLITLKVNPDDIPTVIGKDGRLAKSLRCIFRTLGSKTNSRIALRIDTQSSGIDL